MSQNDQINFVTELCGNIAGEVKRAILEGKIPDDWDGHELRRYLADRFEQSAAMSDCMKVRSKRFRAYRNHILITSGL